MNSFIHIREECYLTFWRLRVRVAKNLVLVTEHVVVDVEFVWNGSLEGKMYFRFYSVIVFLPENTQASNLIQDMFGFMEENQRTSGASTKVCMNFLMGCMLLDSSPITCTTTPSFRVACASTCRIFVWQSRKLRAMTLLWISWNTSGDEVE